MVGRKHGHVILPENDMSDKLRRLAYKGMGDNEWKVEVEIERKKKARARSRKERKTRGILK